MNLEQRVNELERRQEISGKDTVTWITVRYDGEVGPTQEEIKEAQTTYIKRFGKPTGIVVIYFFNGVASAKGVELTKYQYEPSSTGGRPFKETVNADQ